MATTFVVSRYAGNIRNCFANWELITDNKFILSVVKGYELSFHSDPVQYKRPTPPSLSEYDKNVTGELLQNLIRIGAITVCAHDLGEYFSCVFPVPKQNGKHRLVLNLKNLNEFMKYEHFKLEDWRTVTTLMDKDMFMVKIDLKDAYHFVPIGKSSRKYLRFEWQGKAYEYQCLPFGLSVAPLIFTKLMKVLAKHLRKLGYLSVFYLDDILLLGRTEDECKSNLNMTLSWLNKLGFAISEKSELTPKKAIEYLGLVFNSENCTVSLPKCKVNKIQALGKKFLEGNVFQIRQAAVFIGTLTAACPGVRNAPLYTRQLEKEKSEALRKNGNSYEGKMVFSVEACDDIRWWLNHVEEPNPIKSHFYNITIESDASLLFWGSVCNGQKARGKFTSSERVYHINVLELLAVEYALKSFTGNSFGQNILLRVDNKAAISYLNKFGGCRSSEMHKVAKRIWEWCASRSHTIYATYIASKDNCIADSLSRKDAYFSEWRLGNYYFQKLCNEFYLPEVDLFASYANTQCAMYCSWQPDPGCAFVDAFTISWNNRRAYAFPPFSLVAKVLQKINKDKATIIVVAPNWQSQPWYPKFLHMATSKIITFGPNKSLLFCPYTRESHPLCKLQLMAAVLCGAPSKKKA